MSISKPVDRSATGYGAYKYQWARHVARQSLASDVQLVKQEIAKSNPDLPADAPLREFAQRSPSITFGQPPKEDGKFNMGIVGSGIAGLFTAALIDELNKRIPELEISYDILEAGGKKRLGGRLYTHRFGNEPPQAHQYYDVGAMRFPKNEVMERTFRLFDFLDIKEGGSECPRLIPYYLTDDKACPTLFNDKLIYGKVSFDSDDKSKRDPFEVNKWLPENDPDRIDESVINRSPTEVIDEAIASLIEQLRKDMDRLAQSNDPLISDKPDAGWQALMKADFLTTREFFRRKGPIDDSGVSGLGYSFNTIEWLETYAYATGWYNQSLAETVLETLDFSPPKDKDKEGSNYWYCIDGGTQLLPEKLASKLSKQPEFNKKVIAIDTNLETGNITLKTTATAPDDWDHSKKFEPPEPESRTYFTVFNSTTLGALQKMDLSKANLLYGTKQAIRSLNYGASCKVAIQFKEMWWQHSPWNIKKGGTAKTDLPLRVCVYPSYNIHDDDDDDERTGRKEGVLLCSYSWAQDAQRMGTLIDPRSPQNESELVDLMLSNLARLHGKSKDRPDIEWEYEDLFKHLKKLYKTHHAYDWYHDPNMSGAFGYFGPGQFSKMWPQIIKPNGWLFLIGEAASAHHGWIVGALESSVRAMYQLLVMLNDQVLKKGGKFEGYTKAIDFLVGKKDKNHPDWRLPFVGLPREIPVRQTGTLKDSKVQEATIEEDIDLSFIAAQVIASYFQMFLEDEEQKMAAASAVAAVSA